MDILKGCYICYAIVRSSLNVIKSNKTMKTLSLPGKKLMTLITALVIHVFLFAQSDPIKMMETGQPANPETENVRSNAYKSMLSNDLRQRMVYCMIDAAFEYDFTITGTVSFNNIDYYSFEAESFFTNETFYLREDTLQGKLWAYDAATGREWLTVDMGMEIGDTMILAPRYIHYYDTIAVADSIFYDDQGLKHILFNISCYNSAVSPTDHRLEFIEGVGSNFGLGYQVETNFPIVYQYQEILICAFHNQEIVYSLTSPSVIDCHLWVDNIEKLSKENVKLWPNPCKNGVYVSIYSEVKREFSVLIRDVTGKVVMNHSGVVSGNATFIPLHGISSGVYFAEFKNENAATVYYVKVVVE